MVCVRNGVSSSIHYYYAYLENLLCDILEVLIRSTEKLMWLSNRSTTKAENGKDFILCNRFVDLIPSPAK